MSKYYGICYDYLLKCFPYLEEFYSFTRKLHVKITCEKNGNIHNVEEQGNDN